MRSNFFICCTFVYSTLCIATSGLSFDQPELILQSDPSRVNIDSNEIQVINKSNDSSANDPKLTPTNLGNFSTNYTNLNNNCSLTNSKTNKLSN